MADRNPWMDGQSPGSYEQKGLYALAWELRELRRRLFPEGGEFPWKPGDPDGLFHPSDPDPGHGVSG